MIPYPNKVIKTRETSSTHRGSWTCISPIWILDPQVGFDFE